MSLKDLFLSFNYSLPGLRLPTTRELLAIEGIEGIYQTLEEVEREATLVTIATIAGIANGIMIIGEKLYEWNQKYQKSLQTPNDSRIKKVLIVFDDNRRLLLKDATLE